MTPTAKRSLFSGLIMAGTLAITSQALAATTIRLGWTTADSDVDPYAITAHYFAEELDKAAPDEFEVKFFPNHQLGDDTEMLQGMQLGILDAGVITGTQISTLDTAFQLNDLPFLYANSEQAHEVLDGEIGQALMDRLDAQGIVGLGFAEAGFRNTINNVRAIQTPDDFDGIKLRVQPSDLYIASFRALGANPTPLAWSEAFTAVQQGTVDGLEIPLPVIYANKYPEVTKYLSLTQHTYNALGLLISKQTFKSLSADQQATVRQAAQKAIARQRETVASNNDKILDQIENQGMQVNRVENVAAFRDKVKPVYEEYRDKIGSDLLDRALQITTQ
ncbi:MULTISPECIES: TRAP transporter substrate-binding protein [unclassified Modicisalibacter]|uniref:TRAP transporter substrate-binding protein n=1 Tax=unclassified Modicisalibacter TaxID=2679913 RepID=UPI001CC9CF8A|nr:MULTISPECIES: TRAP transporter substrate-binding protein [unclassified Modicisalibacter]MBZ9556523.1 TRAP transporter substrate-binding protein [Modicisalibacter sp. R2A 31.J]MBZ9575008.1 TRAP transporter substrate-binding protein [Modicisalibacter sp. MOD 31.J]